MKRAGLREFWEVLITGADRIVSGHRGESTPTIFPSLMQIPRRDRFLVPFGHLAIYLSFDLGRAGRLD